MSATTMDIASLVHRRVADDRELAACIRAAQRAYDETAAELAEYDSHYLSACQIVLAGGFSLPPREVRRVSPVAAPPTSNVTAGTASRTGAVRARPAAKLSPSMA